MTSMTDRVERISDPFLIDRLFARAEAKLSEDTIPRPGGCLEMFLQAEDDATEPVTVWSALSLTR